MSMLISIVVPIYNVEAYLPACLDSLLAQTYADVEVILVDDGSTDACGAICDDYAARDKRFRVIHKENGGLVSARKAGLQEAHGEYVTYVDGDDSIEADLIAQCMDAIARCATADGEAEFFFVNPKASSASAEASAPDVLLHGYSKDSEAAQEIKTSSFAAGVYRGEALHSLRRGMLSLPETDTFTFGVEPSVWSKVFKRELLLPYQMAVPDEITIGEDVAVTYPLLADERCGRVLIDNDITGYRYRVTPVSMTRSLNPEYFRKISSLYRYLKDKVPVPDDCGILAQIEDYRFYMIVTKTEEIRYRSDMTEAEQIAYLKNASEQADILDHLDEEAKKRFRGEMLKRLVFIQNRNWKALYRSYRLEPLKEAVYAKLHGR